MACPPTHIVVKGELKNGSDDCLASLNYSNYQASYPDWCKEERRDVVYDHEMKTHDNMVFLWFGTLLQIVTGENLTLKGNTCVFEYKEECWGY
ncbi:hypothetical protein Goari_021942 [Gossypium aridum]|uniref:Uncharacterized protein n=1 Tax=Gossypium aridum TaxID=34290 RepID=A0A7J8YQU5_GOSAI|nr:hypothetical protein [Gossypium aridum]